MPNYRYDAFYDRFFPDVRDADGKSLEAKTGMVVCWDSPPSPAEWSETSDPVTWPAQDAPSGPPARPQEPFRDDAEPETPVAVPGLPEHPTGTPEPELVPEP